MTPWADGNRESMIFRPVTICGACVRIMESALRQSTKDGTALWQKLAADGVFTEEAYRAAMPQ